MAHRSQLTLPISSLLSMRVSHIVITRCRSAAKASGLTTINRTCKALLNCGHPASMVGYPARGQTAIPSGKCPAAITSRPTIAPGGGATLQGHGHQARSVSRPPGLGSLLAVAHWSLVTALSSCNPVMSNCRCDRRAAHCSQAAFRNVGRAVRKAPRLATRLTANPNLAMRNNGSLVMQHQPKWYSISVQVAVSRFASQLRSLVSAICRQ